MHRKETVMSEAPPPPPRPEGEGPSAPNFVKSPQPGAYGSPPPPEGYGYPPPPAPPGYGPGAPWAGAPSTLSPQDERMWGMFAHLSAFVATLVAMAFLGPLIIMLTMGTRSAFVRRQAVEALNFQITLYIAVTVSALLILVVVGIVLLPAVLIGWVVLTIMAALAANRGEDYRYPVNLRLVK